MSDSRDQAAARDGLHASPHLLTGCVNFRDLGGSTTTDRTTVRQGVLYRSDSLHRMTDGDRSVLSMLGIQTLIDLRSESESGDQPVVLDVDAGARLVRHPIPDNLLAALDDEDGPLDRLADMEALYARMILVGGPAFGAALRTLSQRDALPAVFFCSSGKDRTGVLAAIVLLLLGVPEESVIADFARSEAVADILRQRVKALHPNHAEDWKMLPPDLLDVRPEALAGALRASWRQFGSVEDYALAFGVGLESVESLRSALLIT